MKRIYIIVGLLSIFGFAVLSKYEDRPAIRALDYAVTVKVQDRIDRSTRLRLSMLVGNGMEGATFFASPEFTVVLTLIVTGVMAYDRRNRRWDWKAGLIPVALVLLVAMEVYGKSIVHHPSPPFGFIKNPISVFPANYINEQFSYPSGHAARAIFLSVLLFGAGLNLASWRKRHKMMLSIGLVGYVSLVSVSRIYLGYHWFSDVVGGLLLGAGVSFMTVSLWNRRT